MWIQVFNENGQLVAEERGNMASVKRSYPKTYRFVAVKAQKAGK